MLAALIRKELLALCRDPHGLAALFLMPLVFIVIMSLALKDYYTPSTRELAYAVIDAPQGAHVDTLLKAWQKRRGQPQPAPADWQAALASGTLRYVIRFAPDFDTAIEALNAPREQKIRLIADPGLEYALFRNLESELAASVGELRADAVQARFNGPGRPGANAITRLVASERLDTGVRPTAVQQNVPAWLVFGMFFVVTAIAGLFVQEAAEGTLSRLRSLGVPRRIQILAKALPYFGINAIQAALMLSAGVWLMPALGGDRLQLAGIDWFALVLMLGAISAAAIGFALAVASLVRSHAQASALGAMCNLLMAGIGGIMVPVFVMPPVMQKAAAWSPMNWSLEGLLQILLRHGDVAAVVPAAGRLLAFALFMSLVAGLLFRRRMK
ncbi:ABC transporter permease [Uliginosibacterium paludis]|uniref:ABC transporter permease n=1 Tax=Uliginosibacterium paludis TaxID=1615952 RepID=A0ABV2CLY5_9RHOO